MALSTPSTIRTLQRKLYRKAEYGKKLYARFDKGRWEWLTAVVRGRRVRRSGREQPQGSTSVLLYLILLLRKGELLRQAHTEWSAT